MPFLSVRRKRFVFGEIAVPFGAKMRPFPQLNYVCHSLGTIELSLPTARLIRKMSDFDNLVQLEAGLEKGAHMADLPQ